ncbi:MAG: undecaprenyl/decaprenyl-phosphate alpha-N-acetylglucosaminyl 1-phosphate transferase [Flavobacteriales bacterium]|nr:undecaprenyl/decaprenyl-phosphate alpha-N-acetylglucosaminyl 1-phosphate transferase [Flavobacteriales bacterium]
MSTFIEVVSVFFKDNILIFSLTVFALSLVAAYRTFPMIVYVSVIKNLTASPNERSSHQKSTPHLGGLGVSFGAFFVSGVFGSFMLDSREMSILISVTASLVILFSAGLKDDIFGLSPKIKLFVEVLSALIFIVLTDIRIDSFYGLFGINELPVAVSYIYTIFVFVIIINSYNLIDGIDGLAASIALIIFSCFLYYFISIKSFLAVICISSMLGSILAFLRFNLSKGKRKIFMGDVGSLVIGYVLALFTTMILSTEFSSVHVIDNKPVFILALFAFPFLDTLRVFALRGISGNSPFLADKNHFHHKLLEAGFSHIQSTIFIILYCLIIIVCSFLLFDNMILKHFILILVLSILLLLSMIWLLSKAKK